MANFSKTRNNINGRPTETHKRTVFRRSPNNIISIKSKDIEDSRNPKGFKTATYPINKKSTVMLSFVPFVMPVKIAGRFTLAVIACKRIMILNRINKLDKILGNTLTPTPRFGTGKSRVSQMTATPKADRAIATPISIFDC